MKNMKMVALVVVVLGASQAFAEIGVEQQSNAITEFQVKQAVSLLLRAGVLGLEESGLVIKRPSLLEELNQQGYVDSAHAVTSAICLKQ